MHDFKKTGKPLIFNCCSSLQTISTMINLVPKACSRDVRCYIHLRESSLRESVILVWCDTQLRIERLFQLRCSVFWVFLSRRSHNQNHGPSSVCPLPTLSVLSLWAFQSVIIASHLSTASLLWSDQQAKVSVRVPGENRWHTQIRIIWGYLSKVTVYTSVGRV